MRVTEWMEEGREGCADVYASVPSFTAILTSLFPWSEF
jgi:hypothetical protein